MPEKQDGGLLAPVQVIDDEHGFAVRRNGSEPRGHRVEESVALSLGVRVKGRWEPRNDRVHFRHEPYELTSMPTEQLRARARPDNLCQRLHEWLEWHCQILVTTAVEDSRSTIDGTPGNLLRQASLPDARF